MNDGTLLDIQGLGIELTRTRPARPLVRDVSLAIRSGESVGLVGESGSGKSMTVKAAMRLLPADAKVDGDIMFEGRSVLRLDRSGLASYRRADVAMIHQDPRAHTNPIRTVGDFVTEAVVTTGRATKREAAERARELLEQMGVHDADRRLQQYPHQLSGGLLQRVMIAAALMTEPRLIFADEPTTALDVTVQSEVVAILAEQVRQRGLGMLFITHDLDLAAAITDTLAVMYAGTLVEKGPSADLYAAPRHPYTAALLASRPSATEVRRLVTIPGRPVAAFEVEQGCAFAARCPFAVDRCRGERPALRDIGGRSVACHRAEEVASELKMAASA
ncbi:oligopeptide/dipeptide ABC transporter ATP-binding protein [Nocardioides aromaticivorans]|uniref:ABC transporter ATP-binding protein n=2 Tax=Nocardioides TaxID=1839 RepID=A0A7Z0CLG8_9ACTN|nr:ABC transporter ATP-binding protein [Nocardioides aromaticivorans]NYD33321.1 oligopeptide/dipeptide ABC transporter ATP-binding protein [Nocardioides kongjuensis]NYI45751.1 oligopeptide/dipeptide ABC transporter ATP-binding protein [Nocardioides aromaticivorans]QSR28443.1 ABC transporter ATP-binding protein [Nocardioides aromaticivorans]